MAYFLTKGFTEEVKSVLKQECFYILSHLLEEIIPVEYYTNMISLTADINILLVLLSEKMPRLLSHFRRNQFELPMVLVEMFITIFTSNKTPITDTIMDAIMLEGSHVMLKAVLLFFEQFEYEIMMRQDFSKIFSINSFYTYFH